MAIRTTSSLVQAILADNWDGSTNLSPFIATASRTVDRVVVCAAAKGMALTTAEALDMETWLAGHAYAMVDQTYASKNSGKSSATFHGQTGMHLDATKYGQMAQMIDMSGCLAALASGTQRRVAGITWAGKSPSEQVPLDQRD